MEVHGRMRKNAINKGSRWDKRERLQLVLAEIPFDGIAAAFIEFPYTEFAHRLEIDCSEVLERLIEITQFKAPAVSDPAHRFGEFRRAGLTSHDARVSFSYPGEAIGEGSTRLIVFEKFHGVVGDHPAARRVIQREHDAGLEPRHRQYRRSQRSEERYVDSEGYLAWIHVR